MHYFATLSKLVALAASHSQLACISEWKKLLILGVWVAELGCREAVGAMANLLLMEAHCRHVGLHTHAAVNLSMLRASSGENFHFSQHRFVLGPKFEAQGLGFTGKIRSRRRSITVVAAANGRTRKSIAPVSPVTRPTTELSAPTLTEVVVERVDRIDTEEQKLKKAKEVKEVARVEVSSDRTLQRFWRQAVRQLASLPLAIGELCAIAGLSAVGTVITQGERPSWYFENFPDSNPVLGFLSWQWVLGLGFDHVYTSPIYLGLLAMLAASLMACTSTTQLPMVKVARRWSFLKTTQAFSKLEITDSLPQARLSDLGSVLSGHGYQVFARGSALYAFKGLPGRLAPIGVHAALLLIMAGRNPNPL